MTDAVNMVLPVDIAERVYNPLSVSPTGISSAFNEETLKPLEILRNEYSEDQSYKSLGAAEPQRRWQLAVFRCRQSLWYIKITFSGKTGVNSKQQRKADFEALIACIDYQSLTLLDDTVTELILEIPLRSKGETLNVQELPGSFDTLPINNPFTSLACHLVYHSREDPHRVQYPKLEDIMKQSTRLITRHVPYESIEYEDQLGLAVFKVKVENTDYPLVFKSVENPFYRPKDTEELLKEYEHLCLCDDIPTVIQLVGLAVSTDPYTSHKGGRTVIRGILLEYHPSGTIQDCLNREWLHSNWREWPRQIARGLNELHIRDIAHGDLKPENIVLDADYNAILIDLGCNGATMEFLAPECQNIPIGELSLQKRTSSDVWAFGKVLSMLLEREEDFALRIISEDAMREDPALRPAITDIIDKLNSSWVRVFQPVHELETIAAASLLKVPVNILVGVEAAVRPGHCNC